MTHTLPLDTPPPKRASAREAQANEEAWEVSARASVSVRALGSWSLDMASRQSVRASDLVDSE